MIRHSRMLAMIGAAGLIGLPALRLEPTDEERALNDAKLDAQRQEAERFRREERARTPALPTGWPASVNRRTGQPHDHARAKARQLRRSRPA